MDDIGDLDIAAAAKAISSKSLSSAELTERTLKRIGLVDPHLRAYVEMLTEEAQASATEADAEIRSNR